jgi:pimeloyl-ACP methyl ester carboxylesterase
VPTLVFVHGRGQQGREPDVLRRRWAAGLNKGLTAAGRALLDGAAVDAIRFPFYGDVLWAAVVQGREPVPDVAALEAVQQVDPGLPDAVNRRQVAILQAMAGELGFGLSAAPETAVAVPGPALLRGLLEWVANHSGVDEAVIREFLRDVSAYLELPGCRPAVQAVVRPALLADPACVLVGHSLGGVVCAELLAETGVRDRTSLFVAVGAPLGLDAVTGGMRPPGSARPTSPWVNVYDLRDWATLGSPLPPAGGLVGQLAVANPRSHEHSIEHYLAHPEVATVIADALGAGGGRGSR